jgi:nucleoid DNA-binding protein
VPTRERHISRHVKTGQPFTLPASHRIRFTPSKKLLAGDTA